MKIKTMTWIMLVAIVGMAFLTSGNVHAQGDVIVISNKNSAQSSLSSGDVKNIYLGKKTTWANGQKIIFVTLKGSGIHESFLKKYVSKTPSQYKNYWKKMVFTGKGKAPKSFKGEGSLVDYVAGTDGAIGYISSETNAGATQILTIN